MSFVWQTTPSAAWVPATDAYIAAIRRAVYQIAQRRAPEIMAWMKQNAVWVDRTGNARQTLTAEAEQVALDMVHIILAGGVDYFVYLELSNAGRFSIISPALDYWGPIIWNDVQALMAA